MCVEDVEKVCVCGRCRESVCEEDVKFVCVGGEDVEMCVLRVEIIENVCWEEDVVCVCGGGECVYWGKMLRMCVCGIC